MTRKEDAMTENSKVKKDNARNVGMIIFRTMAEHGFLSAGIIAAVIGAVFWRAMAVRFPTKS